MPNLLRRMKCPRRIPVGYYSHEKHVTKFGDPVITHEGSVLF
jgi:hypothetical protein